MVGCVIASKDHVLATGWHQRCGGPHAEIHALQELSKLGTPVIDVPDATLYVTLEPCCHHGKTPPCTDAIVSSGIRRVVVAMTDPYPALPVAGGYTYERVYTASSHNPMVVFFPLAPEAVAHFRHYPIRGQRAIDRANETHSPADLRVVDKTDPLHRPSYLLTPSLKVRVYAGHQVADVSSLKLWRRAQSRLARRPRQPLPWGR